jgi:hypothetical protein
MVTAIRSLSEFRAATYTPDLSQMQPNFTSKQSAIVNRQSSLIESSSNQPDHLCSYESTLNSLLGQAAASVGVF